MGSVKVPYYSVVKGRGYWQPTTRMRAAGFAPVRCGIDGPQAWRIAAEWNERWQAARRGDTQRVVDPAITKAGAEFAENASAYPVSSVGEAFARFRRTEEWARKKPRTREDWWRGWKRIKPIFGDIAPYTIDLEDLSAWRAVIEAKHGRREAHRALKIWRALWKVAAALKYCDRESDPSLAVRNSAAKGRSATWTEGEVVRLVKGAWRQNYRGLAAAMAVIWDAQFSPVDVRTLIAGQLHQSGGRAIFTERGKTGKPIGGLLGRRATAIVGAWLQGLGAELLPGAPIFRTRGLPTPGPRGGRPRPGAPFTKNSLAVEFRMVRTLVFGEAEKRQLQDFRRSGAVEAIAGGAKAEELAHGMGNTLGSSNALYETYVPVNLATLKTVAEARRKGRAKLRKGE